MSQVPKSSCLTAFFRSTSFSFSRAPQPGTDITIVAATIAAMTVAFIIILGYAGLRDMEQVMLREVATTQVAKS